MYIYGYYIYGDMDVVTHSYNPSPGEVEIKRRFRAEHPEQPTK